tara:strand:+ start:1389 stop:1646 length:258 start_codon:yes stop_codon:yes gene_type:complete
MKTLVTFLAVSLCLLIPGSGVATPSEQNQKIENVWVKIKGQWDHHNNTVLLKKQILFSFEDTSEAKLKKALKKLPFLTTTAINDN